MEAPYLTCHNLSASYDSTVLFNALSFAVHPGERWGIVGPNGAGKSTIFKLISGLIKPVEGVISIRNNVRVAFIDQKINFDENLSVEQILRKSLPLEYDTDSQTSLLEQEIEEHEKLSEKNPELFENEKWLEKFTDLNVKLSEVAGTPTTNIIQSALKAGNLVEIAENNFKNLSGGQQKRVQIVAALLKNPHLILMDEPTNHLDVQTVEWLEEFLLQVVEQGFSLFGFKSTEREIEPVAYVIISHDRALLDTLVNKILEVEDGEAKQYEGNYEAYSQLKLEHMLVEEKTRSKMANTMRRELEWLRSGTRARTTKQTARIERAKALDKNLSAKEKKAGMNKNAEVTFSAQMVSEQRDKDDFIVARHHNLGEQELIKITSATLPHPSAQKDHYLFQNLNLLIKPRMRIAILGPNGSGKSTLLNYIVNKIKPQTGEIKYHDLTHISYFDQKRNNINYNESIRKNIAPEGDNVFFGGKYIHIMSYLERFLFYKFDANRTVSELSGGEQARLLLAKLMLEQGNVLILDEPTNDLDIPTLQVLEKNLIDFNGGVLFTSHDRYFMQRVATSLLTYLGEENKKSQWGLFADLNQALEHVELFQEEQKQKSKQKNKPGLENIGSSNNDVALEPKKKKLSFKEQNEFNMLEKKIEETEKKIAQLSQTLEEFYTLNKSPSDTKKLVNEIDTLQKELNILFVQWEKMIN